MALVLINYRAPFWIEHPFNVLVAWTILPIASRNSDLPPFDAAARQFE